MAHKTFISYKYSEAQKLRDKIVNALGDDATYYMGETAESPDLTDEATSTIKSKLTDMMYDTTVTIVILSPNMTQSNWIDWEIEYCLKEISRKGRTSKTNGLVGVVQRVNSSYDWLVTTTSKNDGCSVRTYATSKFYSIINDNRFNLRDKSFKCRRCETYDALKDSYFSIVDEADFLTKPEHYIDNAFNKAENANDFNLTKQRN
ncbi:MAG: TIR domain-containing protein [Gammaproteobacteria bacterium]|nr:TIR domain-containing protein [Gammaproteobacteria bacterium]